MGAGIHKAGRNLPDSPITGPSPTATGIAPRTYCSELIAGEIRLADIPADFRDYVLSLAEYTILKLAVGIASSRDREAWKAALFAVPEDLREHVNSKAVKIFHRRNGC